MSVCVVIQSGGIGGSGGSDPTPGAVNWTDILSYTGTGQTNAQTISGTDKPIQLRASFTLSGYSIGVSAIVNGATVATIGATGADQLDFYASTGASIVFEVRVAGSGSRAASGTFTIINLSDSNTTLDTFTYYVER